MTLPQHELAGQHPDGQHNYCRALLIGESFPIDYLQTVRIADMIQPTNAKQYSVTD